MLFLHLSWNIICAVICKSANNKTASDQNLTNNMYHFLQFPDWVMCLIKMVWNFVQQALKCVFSCFVGCSKISSHVYKPQNIKKTAHSINTTGCLRLNKHFASIITPFRPLLHAVIVCTVSYYGHTHDLSPNLYTFSWIIIKYSLILAVIIWLNSSARVTISLLQSHDSCRGSIQVVYLIEVGTENSPALKILQTVNRYY